VAHHLHSLVIVCFTMLFYAYSFQKNAILNVQDIESMLEFLIEHFHDLSHHSICSTHQT